MKKIFLIESAQNGLNSVKLFLSEINASYVEYSSAEEASAADENPDLIILQARSQVNYFMQDVDIISRNANLSETPKIYITPPSVAESIRDTSLDRHSVINMPVDKKKLLSKAAEFMKIPYRRVFRIIITILPEGSNVRHSALSLDFSESGMAFETRTNFEKGTKITVNFVDPRNSGRMVLNAEIIRTMRTQSDTTGFFGVRFINLSGEDKNRLASFVRGEPAVEE
jgi:hypothetical protein